MIKDHMLAFSIKTDTAQSEQAITTLQTSLKALKQTAFMVGQQMGLVGRSVGANYLKQFRTEVDRNLHPLQNMQSYFDGIYGAANRVTPAIKSVSQSAMFLRGQIMGIGFAALFGGMALYRVFGGALRSLFNNYKEVMAETSEFNQMTNRLSGAWTFFKFTLMDALMQTGLFQAIVGFLIKVIEKVSEFTSKHPMLTQIAMVFMAIVAILGLLAMIIGQPILMLSFLGTSAKAASLTFLTGFGKVIGIILLLALTITLITKILDSDLPNWAKGLLSLGTVVLGIAGAWVLVGKAGVASFTALGKAALAAMKNPVIIAIAAIITGLILLSNHVGGLKNAFAALGVFLLRIWAFVGDALVESIIGPMRDFINLINAAIAGLHKVGLGKNLEKIDISFMPKFGLGMGSKVDAMRNKLLADGLAEKLEKDSVVGNDLSDIQKEVDSYNLGSYIPPVFENHTEKIEELDKKLIEQQQINNDYAAENLEEVKNTNSILTTAVGFLGDMAEFYQQGNSTFGLNSSTGK